jgi:ATP-dependent Lon protease
MNRNKLHKKEYKLLKKQMHFISNELIFLKEYIQDLSNNLINLHKLKIYENFKCGYSVYFNELVKIKSEIEIFPDIININYLKNKNKSIEDIINIINQVKRDLIRLSYNISPSDIRHIFYLFLGPYWYNLFNKEDHFMITLISRLFNPTNVCDSFFHSNLNEDISSCPLPKRNPFNPESLNTLLDDNVKTTSIVINDMTTFPNFIKTITDLLNIEKLTMTNERNNMFNFDKLKDNFKHSNIIFTKILNTSSMIEEKNGLSIVFKISIPNNDLSVKYIALQGFVKDDMIDIYKSNNMINKKYESIKKYINSIISPIPKTFIDNFLMTLNIKDILLYNNDEINKLLIKRFSDLSNFKTFQLGQLISEFLFSNKFRKYDILLCFLSGEEYDRKLAYLLYDVLRIKDKKEISIEIYNSLPTHFKVLLDEVETLVNNEEEQLIKNHVGDLSYERRINMLKLPNSIKDKAIEKLKSMKGNFQGDNKAQSWLDGFLKIPFGVYKNNKIMDFKKDFIKKLNQVENIYSCEEINKYLNNLKSNDLKALDLKAEWDNYNIEKSKYLKNVHNYLDEAIYGHKDAKLQLERLFAQWINGETKGAIIGLCGPPGTGKTSLAKNGLSKCLIDDNNIPRPFGFLPIGGSVNGSTLVGHNFTYVGSSWGRIVDILITTKCMNPIIFIDEVDKISNTEYGKEITGVLTHLTDLTQNDSFEDKYFSGIPLDLSKALIVFSFNDIDLIDPILRDRITVIETKPYNLHEKIQIINKYMLPEIFKDVGFSNNEIIFPCSSSNCIITYLIETYTNEAGVRKIKEKLLEIVRDINLNIIHTNDNNNNYNTYEYYSHEYYGNNHNYNYNYKLPFTITKEYIDDLFKNKPKMKINMIHKKPEIGLVNGLYATTSGIGGLTVIQVMKYPSDKMLDLTLTGQQGDVMKESVMYALRIAYNMLNDEEKNKILEDSYNKKNFGLLVHTPEAATKKDGPSAGAAMTLAIYSVLTGKKIRNDVAMTGEIDLCKNVRAIGGLHAKLTGAKVAGVKLALIPKENENDLKILRNENISPEDNEFKVELIETFDDVIKFTI